MENLVRLPTPSTAPGVRSAPGTLARWDHTAAPSTQNHLFCASRQRCGSVPAAPSTPTFDLLMFLFPAQAPTSPPGFSPAPHFKKVSEKTKEVDLCSFFFCCCSNFFLCRPLPPPLALLRPHSRIRSWSKLRWCTCYSSSFCSYFYSCSGSFFLPRPLLLVVFLRPQT